METLVTPKIFLVEDDQLYNQAVKDSFQKIKFNDIKTFSNVKDFLSVLKTEKPDLVILDEEPGEIDDPALLDKVKAVSSDIRVVILSDHEQPENTFRKGKRRFDFIKKDKSAFSKLRAIAMRTGSELGEKREERKNNIYKVVFFTVFISIVITAIMLLRFRSSGFLEYR